LSSRSDERNIRRWFGRRMVTLKASSSRLSSCSTSGR
jgi:hypothetical protein